MVQRVAPASRRQRRRSTLKSVIPSGARNPCVPFRKWRDEMHRSFARKNCGLRACPERAKRVEGMTLDKRDVAELLRTERRALLHFPRVLYTRWFLERSAIFHAQADIPTQSPAAVEDARLPGAHADQGRACGAGAAPGAGPQAGLGAPGLPGVAGRRPCRTQRISGSPPRCG